MTLNIQLPENTQIKPQITVFGVGGAGGNATNNMIQQSLEGVNFVVANTDAQALENSSAENKIQLGKSTTKGLGAGAAPEVGSQAAEEAMDEILENLQGSNMVFITAGMGGGTGTGAAPVIARASRELDILTVGVVTKPFHFEGPRRMRVAEEGLEELQKHVDTLIVIPNQNLFRVANEKTTFADAFSLADEVLHSGVRGITDLMVMPGLINLDYADVRSVMKDMGKAMMGTGESEGEKRAHEAAVDAISNPLLDTDSMYGARGVLINITGGSDMTLFEVDEAANRIREEVDPSANIIFGSTFNPDLNGKIRVSVVATGIDADQKQPENPKPTFSYYNEKPLETDASDTEEIDLEEEVAQIQEDEAAEEIESPATTSEEVFKKIEEEVENAFSSQDQLNKEYYDAVKNLNAEFESNKVSQENYQYPTSPEELNSTEMDPSFSTKQQSSFQNLAPDNNSLNYSDDDFSSEKEASSFGFFGKMAKVAKSFQSDNRENNSYDQNTNNIGQNSSNNLGGSREKELAFEESGNPDDFSEESLDVPAFLRRKPD